MLFVPNGGSRRFRNVGNVIRLAAQSYVVSGTQKYCLLLNKDHHCDLIVAYAPHVVLEWRIGESLWCLRPICFPIIPAFAILPSPN